MAERCYIFLSTMSIRCIFEKVLDIKIIYDVELADNKQVFNITNLVFRVIKSGATDQFRNFCRCCFVLNLGLIKNL